MMMKRVRKQTVKAVIRKQGYIDVKIIPCKASLNSPWRNLDFMRINTIEELEKQVFAIKLWLCNWETGYYPAYYIKEGE